ncbi:hypothetical protein [Lolliginicoccus levis]|uniref:hypothetical protein n=1 Tax=Lolliginicoccus levis TaxID=2919542 RepID=UPI00241CAB53|nr:hypothetical protein [Lolliginicoccus levis]
MEHPAPLVIDPREHAAEIARFWAHVVRGPGEDDCWLWTGAISDDGYGRYWLKRAGRQRVVRPHRYALSLALGRPLAADEVAMHGCDSPICVRAGVHAAAGGHVVLGTQADNLRDMAIKRRGGGWPGWMHVARSSERVARSRALRAAVSGGWDAGRVRAALDAAELAVHPGQHRLF